MQCDCKLLNNSHETCDFIFENIAYCHWMGNFLIFPNLWMWATQRWSLIWLFAIIFSVFQAAGICLWCLTRYNIWFHLNFNFNELVKVDRNTLDAKKNAIPKFFSTNTLWLVISTGLKVFSLALLPTVS